MKKLTLILFIAIGINSFAQDISKLPPSVPYKKSMPGNLNDATTHGNFAYDTLKFWTLNKYGINQDATGKFDDIYDTLYIQRKVSFGYTPSGTRDNIEYKFVTISKK